jgi:hypothetical protein
MLAVVKCPKKDETFEIEVSNKVDDVQRFWRQTIELSCPHCGEGHLEGYKQLYLQAMVRTEGWDAALNGQSRPRQRRQNALF